MNKAVFMRQGGVLLPPLRKDNSILNRRFYSYVPEALNIIGNAGFLIAVVDNCEPNVPGLAIRSLYDMATKKIQDFTPYNVVTSTCYISEEQDHPDKIPNPGLIQKIMGEFSIDPSLSIMIVSTKEDVMFGRSADIEKFLALRTTESSWRRMPKDIEIEIVDNLLEAAKVISNGSVAN